MKANYTNKEWLMLQIKTYKNITDISLNTGIPKTTLKRNIDKLGLTNLLEKKKKLRKPDFDKYPYKNKEWLESKLIEHGTPNQISRYENIPETSIRRYIEKFNLKHLIDALKHKKPDEKKHIYLYKNDEWLIDTIMKYKTVPNICKETGFASTSVRRYIKKFGFEEYLEDCPTKRIRTLDEDYFQEIDSERKAYWLGMLMADGNVANYNNRYCIRLTLKQEDTYIVEEFKKDLKSDAPIYIDKHNRATLRVWSKKMFNDLQLHGIIPRKTGKEIIPSTIPDELIHHFIRGFFDGDGTINIRSNRERHKGTVGFCCQNKAMLDEIIEIFQKKCDLTISCIYHKNHVYEAKTESFSKCTSIVNFMYNNATIAMLRKFRRAKQYFNLQCPSLKQFEDEFRLIAGTD